MTMTANNARVVPAGTGRVRQVGPDLVRVKASGADTDGRYEVFEVTSMPGAAVPLHRHNPAETFYVLEGRFHFHSGEGDGLVAAPGDVIVIPASAPHSFENVGDGPGRLLTMLAPAGMERFFDAVGVPLPDDATLPEPPSGPPDVERLMEIAAAHGIEMIGAP